MDWAGNIYMLRLTQGVCVSVCVSVCLYVCLSVYLCYLHSPNGWGDFDEIFQKWSHRYLQGLLFLDFEISKPMTSWRPFWFFLTKRSHGRNYASIVFKIAEKVENSDPMFATKNHENQLKFFVNMAKIHFWWPFLIYFKNAICHTY